MNKYRFELLRREFPFLMGILEKLEVSSNDLHSIKVERGDSILLSKKPFKKGYDCQAGRTEDYNLFFSVEKDSSVFQFADSGEFGWGNGDHREWNCSTIGEQIFENKLNFSFIVEVTKNDSSCTGEGEIRYVLKIFKMKDFDSIDYFKNEIEAHASILKREIEEIFK